MVTETDIRSGLAAKLAVNQAEQSRASSIYILNVFITDRLTVRQMENGIDRMVVRRDRHCDLVSRFVDEIDDRLVFRHTERRGRITEDIIDSVVTVIARFGEAVQVDT